MNSPLDEALLAAQKDQTKGDAFYDLFLNTVLFMPTADIAAAVPPFYASR